ncbi:MAG: LysR family transcriptional regulator [Saccharopolyspora sp.]|uniref:LysR family transcriptional regulator n=1 Tax=Saccharopolyspora TaxID=1835 RepID=UPI001909B3A4|nr:MULTISPECIES: LysR family transcriptional regulator [unclassified Saccharopolyspora]MBK0870268.1 LysR family transcriptional regulator [Saccharopolyspora sp. HNM0986]MBQ6641513.1 LysR family transcriptional regulator [Saccharopolyspora sp.]
MVLHNVDLNLLLALDALLTERHVTRAAERNMVGQAAMSASLARLRKHFGDVLLVKERNRLVLTPLAESLVAPAREAIAAAEATMAVSEPFDPTTDHRTFRVIASDYAIFVLLKSLLAEFAAHTPRIHLNLLPIPDDYLDQLRRGQVDLLIAPTAFTGPNFPFPHEVLFEDGFVLAADRDNPDIGRSVSPEEFARLPSVAFGGGPLRSLIEVQLDELGVQRNVEIFTQSWVINPFLLKGTRLVSIVHERLARPIANRMGLRLLPPPAPLRPIIEAMYWHSRNTNDSAHRWLRTQIADAASRM